MGVYPCGAEMKFFHQRKVLQVHQYVHTLAKRKEEEKYLVIVKRKTLKMCKLFFLPLNSKISIIQYVYVFFSFKESSEETE